MCDKLRVIDYNTEQITNTGFFYVQFLKMRGHMTPALELTEEECRRCNKFEIKAS